MMFEHLSKFKKIVVVGSQRSGTTIAAKMIADDLKYEYVDESWFHVKDALAFKNVILKGIWANPRIEQMVIQAPALTTQIHNLVDDEVLVIFMVRDKNDILKSKKKITGGVCGTCGREYGFELNEKQRTKIFKKYRQHIISKHDDKDVTLAYPELTKSDKTTIDTLYSMWYGFQKHRIKNAIELEYDSLSSHHLWIPKEQRTDFHKKQTELR